MAWQPPGYLTAAATNLPLLLCPSDPIRAAATRPDLGKTSYIACVANTDNWCADPTWSEGLNGSGNAAYVCTSTQKGLSILFGNSKTNIAAITDGTSNTMVMSEWTTGFPYVQQNNNFAGCIAGTETPLTAASYTGSYEPLGYSWIYANGMHSWAYSTLLKPNDPVVKAQGNQVCVGSPWVGPARFGARSEHVGGVHVLLADGAVRFVSDSINLTTWQNLGNRMDGNVMGEF